MRKMNNKGFSMVEILISIAIFAVLMIPIVGAIISSLKNTTEAKTLQYRNEFVENVVEYVKQDSLDGIFSGNYFSTVGSYTGGSNAVDVSGTFYMEPPTPAKPVVSYDDSLQPIVNVLGSKVKTNGVSTVTSGSGFGKKYYPYEEYLLSGKVDLGAKDTTYVYKMLITNKYYAEKESKGSFVNPNNLALGIVEDIDYTKVALINGTIANYDKTVENAFLTKKIALVKQYNPDWYDVYIKQVTDPKMFSDDIGKRLITINISGNETTGYHVSCGLTYNDSGDSLNKLFDDDTESQAKANNVKATFRTDYIKYKPFEFSYSPDPVTKKATLPNIYLMYNTCLYNNTLVENDYIAINNTIPESDPAKVNVFIVETAEGYSSNLTTANTSDAFPVSTTATLYNNPGADAANDLTRGEVKVHIGAVSGSELKNVSVYHNFNQSSRTSHELRYTATDFTSQLVHDTTLLPLVGSSSSVAFFGSLNEAKQESRGLYEIKVWMMEGDDPSLIDINTSVPIMTATKGGNES
ncbi:MAG: prepilin-type N-terminal cleavage/methylation domain-containing protein [Lachnospiraceae bacterium]|nr:prepilin-type N-terminal cleavage/methylation domain-containing protein [Lachnospiraceae bacterium]